MQENDKNKLLIGSGAALLFAGLVAGLSYQVTKVFVREAIDREEPEIMKFAKSMLEGNAEADEEILARVRERKQFLEALPLERAEIESFDGTKLVGHWYPAEGTPKRTILAMHGWRSSWSRDFSIISEFWHDHDCNILLAEQRGQGESGGDHIGFGVAESRDVLEWLKWMNENKVGEEPVYLAGISMGATTILMAAGRGLPANVHGVMADCGFTSPDAIWKHVMQDNLKLRYGPYRGLIAAMVKDKLSDDLMQYSAVDFLKKSTTPVLFVHGTGDTFVPVEMTYENYLACASEKRLLIVPGAEHGLSYFGDEAAYKKAVLDFWRDFD